MTRIASAPREATQALPRCQRIAKRRDFARAYEKGRKVFATHTILFVIPNDLGHPRIGVTTTRKLGTAVVRNRMKRWVRETFRLERDRSGLAACALDIVVNLRRTAVDTTWNEFRRELAQALRRATAVRPVSGDK